MSLRLYRLAVVCGAMLLLALTAATASAGQPLIAPKCCTNCNPSCERRLPPVNICGPVCDVTICTRPPVCHPTCERRLPPVNICKPVCDVTICTRPPVCHPTCERRLPPVNIHPGCEPVLTCNPVCKH